MEMPRCPRCGEVINADSKRCGECSGGFGYIDQLKLRLRYQEVRRVMEELIRLLKKLRPGSRESIIWGIAMGILAGLVSFVVFFQYNSPWLPMALVGLGVCVYSWRRPDSYLTVGSGLYLTGMVVVFVPFTNYLPLVIEEHGQGTGSFIIFLLTGTLFLVVMITALIIALNLVVVGYIVKKHSSELPS